MYLSSKDRNGGFSIVLDDYHNMTLLRWGRPVAWFSVALSEETLMALVKLVKSLPWNGQTERGEP